MWRRLAMAGFALLLLALIDPLEGSLVAGAGLVLVTVAAHRAHLREQRLLDWALGLAVVGLSAVWGFSAVGGVGGTTGRSLWWALTMLPLPVGWLLGLWGGYRVQRQLRTAAG